MISLSISRPSPATALSVSDSGQSGLVLLSLAPGGKLRDNTIAKSRWLSGGMLTATRDEVVQMDARIRVWGTSQSDLLDGIAELDAALAQFSYTVTATYGSATTTYDAMPADWSIAYMPAELRKYAAVMTVSIPRQP